MIKVTDKKAARTVPFEEVKARLMAYLKKDKERKAVQDLLDSLKSSAKIENTLPAPPPVPAMPSMQSMPAPAPAPQPSTGGN